MKILVIGDVHWSAYSSIVRKQGTKYTKRLENLIQSVNWAESVVKEQNCDVVVYLGDFFDKSQLTDIELTALKEIIWTDVPHYFIVGNHESSVNGLRYNSTKALQHKDFNIIDTPTSKWGMEWGIDSTEFVFLPYIIEDDRKNLVEYFDKENLNNQPLHKRIIFSHNDLKNFQMGKFISTTGFDIKEIEDNCDLYFNGHLHNGGFVNDKETILNVGNITGQNFSENASKYDHLVCVLDTDTLNTTYFENPFALNFMNMEVTCQKDIDNFRLIKNSMVLSIRCREDLVEVLRGHLKQIPEEQLLEYRIVSYREDVSDEVIEEQCNLTNTDYLLKFQDFIYENIDRSATTVEEVGEVIK